MYAAAFDQTPAGAPLTRRRKAAMVMQLLLAEGQKLSIARLPEEVQLTLARELAALRLVDRATLDAVAEEFARDLEDLAMAAPGGLDAALAAMADQLSPGADARLRSEAAKARGGDPWVQVIALPAADLVPVMSAESVEVGAVLLSKLPVAKAAELLGLLPGERARRIAFAMSMTGAVTPEAVTRIGRALADEHCGRPVPAFINPAGQRVGAILNSTQATTREDVLEALVGDDPAFAEEVRRVIFTFVDIPARLAPLDVSKAIRGVENAVLVTALAHGNAGGEATATAVDFILSNISQRMASALREEVGERGRVRAAEGEAAMGQVVNEIRARVDAGDLKLVDPNQLED